MRTREPATEAGPRIAAHALREGLIFSVRREGSVLRFVPPATTTEAQIDHAIDILGNALEEVSAH